MTIFTTVVSIVGGLSTICTALVLLCKPIRDKLFQDKMLREGVKCLLRCQMLGVYYRHRDAQTVRQYELENFIQCYHAYKTLGGNSFIDKIHDEVVSWTVTT